MWRVIDSGKKLAEANMRLDEKLLEELSSDGLPILHFYEFAKPAATYGYFVQPEKFLKSGHGLDLARRPTGGGILFHLWDLTFSVLIPSCHFGYSNDVMQNYAFINNLVIGAISECLGISIVHLLPIEEEPLDEMFKYFCFAKPTKYDVMIDGKKVAGAAQRRKKNGFLHQGSISVGAPDFCYLQKILPESVIEAMKVHTQTLQGLSKDDLRASLQKVISRV